jgi:DNA-binding IscR family transcriptional regulator
MVGLAVTYEICRTFHEGKQHWSAREYGAANRVPARLLADVTHLLAQHGIIVAVAGREFCFVPAKDINVLNVAEVEEAFRGTRDAYLKRLPAMAATPAAAAFVKCYEGFARDLAGLTFGRLLADRA